MQNDPIVLQDPKTGLWDTRGVITDIRSNGRSYWVQTNDGKRFLRGRPMLMPDITSDNDQTDRDKKITSRTDNDRQTNAISSDKNQTDNDRQKTDSRDIHLLLRPVKTAVLDRERHADTLTGRNDSQDSDGPPSRCTRSKNVTFH